jgi:hypothetical protein
LLLVAAGCVAATIVGLAVGHGRTVALAAALTLAAALAVAAALELRPSPGQPPPRARDDELPSGLRRIMDVLRETERSESGVDRSLRPLLVPIVAARLGRRGIDMELAPGRAQELLGDRLWEIVRPDGTSVSRRLAGDELREAIERLEQL